MSEDIKVLERRIISLNKSNVACKDTILLGGAFSCCQGLFLAVSSITLSKEVGFGNITSEGNFHITNVIL